MEWICVHCQKVSKNAADKCHCGLIKSDMPAWTKRLDVEEVKKELALRANKKKEARWR